MKKILCALLALLLGATALAENDVIGDNQRQYQLVSCPEGGFTTVCEAGLKWKWDEANGLVIYTGQPDQLPYLLIYPTGNKGTNFEGYFNDTFTPQMKRDLGDGLLEVSKYSIYNLNAGDETVALPGVMYTFLGADGRHEVLFRVFDTRWDENVCYTMRYFEGDPDATMRAMGVAVINYQPAAAPQPTQAPTPQPTAAPSDGPDTRMQPGPRIVTCPEQNWSAVCSADSVTYYDEGAGLYVYTAEWGVVPYILINVADSEIDIPAFFRDRATPRMREKYGADLLEVIDCGNITVGERVLTAVAYRYRYDGDVVYMLRALENRDGCNVSYILKYFEGAPDTKQTVMNALVTLSNSFRRDAHYYDNATIQSGGAPAPGPVSDDGTGQGGGTGPAGDPAPRGMNGYNVRAAEPIVKNLVPYESGRFSMMIPEGWQVESSGITMTFCFKVYDPNNTDRCLFYFNKVGPGLKSQAEKDLLTEYGKWDPNVAIQAEAPILRECSLLAALESYGETRAYCRKYAAAGKTLNPAALPDFENPNVLETWQDDRFSYLGARANTVARLAYTSVATGMGCDGLAFGKAYETTSYVTGVDVGYYVFYGFGGFTAPGGELTELLPVLNQCLSTFRLNEDFRRAIMDELEGEEKTIFLDWSIDSCCSDATSAWEARERSYDIQAQEYSDAVLGYDRLYDADTGEVYRAELGFWDEYDLHRGEYEKSNLQRVDDGSKDYYLRSVDYYIAK